MSNDLKIEVNLQALREKKLFLAVPMYGGMCHGMFAQQTIELVKMMTGMGLQIHTHFLFNESLITRARNYCVDEFMRSDATHFMFIDADIGYRPDDVLVIMHLMTQNPDYDVMGAVYPKKSISWEKIKQAVDKGVADDNPQLLEHFVGDMVFNPLPNGGFALNEPAEVLELGTGFMMFQRATFEKYKEAYKHNSMYKPDHIRNENFDGSREIMMYFQAEIDRESGRYLSEDYLFCQNLRKIGGKIWICPWMELKHSGNYAFSGSLMAMASIGAAATVDPTKLKGKKQK